MAPANNVAPSARKEAYLRASNERGRLIGKNTKMPIE
eukprot:CAMPEP_0171971470 /NCGR_PEP_ID=MMETSP0993-20121228/217950_1 /TAXON_ID=483369 /ORGANISM="non described non described, Strain CCMP2098" /LENGTH=36 /DNA_ID= /DNA_START= /DNA_END= /DNA_ORIENTATION=